MSPNTPPARDDLPVEWDTESRQVQNGVNLVSRTKLRFTDFAQLPGTKQWYATEWRQTGEGSTRDGGVQASTEYRFQLQILPGVKLDEAWFTDPRQRVKVEAAPAKNEDLP